MSTHAESGAPKRKAANKATMDQPQEEFVADQSVPSVKAPPADKDHGAEVQHSKTREQAEAGGDASKDEPPIANSGESR